MQIIHGLSEHGGRYGRFAHALNDAGFAVYAQDLPGHGRTARAPDELGHFADEHGWRFALQSIRAVQNEISERHAKATPISLFGHSMGALLAQDYIIHHGRDIAACVLSASTGKMGVLRMIGVGLSLAQIRFAGPRHRSRISEQLLISMLNRHFKPNRTEFDWLSSDPDEVDRYINDPHCGFQASSELWSELLTIGGRLRKPARLARIPKGLPIMIISGEDDPSTRKGKGPKALAQAYTKAGISHLTLKSYAGARHELLNERCRDTVTQDVLNWLVEHSAPRPR